MLELFNVILVLNLLTINRSLIASSFYVNIQLSFTQDKKKLGHYNVGQQSLADPGGSGGGPPDPPDLEAPVIQFGGLVYNLRAKQ